jgi:[histone H3]-dimethyl-L-lysine9 demethylase
MYNCNGSDSADDPHGSTKLHKDITDAINVMVWAANLPNGQPGYALWHLFHPAVSKILRQSLREEGFDEQDGDLINAQCVYVTEDMLGRLASKYNVRPHVISQRPGDAVFIPAGWGHQVSFYPASSTFSWSLYIGSQQIRCH